jgi:hypothetical protein
MVQTENRPYLKDTNKLHIIYYIAKGTIDERMERLLMPKIETVVATVNDSDASGINSAFESGRVEESLESFLERLSRGAADGEADFGDGDPELGHLD